MKSWFLLLLLCCRGLLVQAQSDSAELRSKTSVSLRAALKQGNDRDSIDVFIVGYGKTTGGAARMRILYVYQPGDIVAARVRRVEVPALLNSRDIRFVDLAKTATEELTTGYLDLAVNRINRAHRVFPAIRGHNILASIKEQRPDTADIDFKGRYRNTGAAATTSTSHAAIMATTLAGAGNTSPFATGAAPAAHITSTSFTRLLPEDDNYYRQHNISIQNHSYGTVNEGYYGAEALAYDQNAVNLPWLVHIFSSGNAGNAAGTGSYASVPGFGNLTGNFKSAKNGITVGATDSFYQVANASSKGPAFDGRIKPEVVAFGEDGTSGAAAMVSGVAALLQQAYQDKKGKLPDAALVKAVLLNTADDLQTPGPDFISGFGSVNAYDAVHTMVTEQFFEDSVLQSAMKQFTVTLPPGIRRLQATLAWTDPAATVNTARALVHDLDMEITHAATGTTYQPWILNAAPYVDSITKKAVTGRDTLNNVEQVTVDQPAAGDYIIRIKGSKIAQGAQPFAVTYAVDTTGSFYFTAPMTGDPLVGGTRAIVRWQSDLQDRGTLSYTLDGLNWQVLKANLDLSEPFYRWETPDTIAIVQLRMQAGSQTFYSDSFALSKNLVLKTGFNCRDSFLLYWNRLQVTEYQLYGLGARYLEPLVTTKDSFLILKKTDFPYLHYSVAPVLRNQQLMKSFTVNYTAQGVGCYLRTFYVQSQDSSGAVFFAQLGSLYQVDSVLLQKWNGSGFFSLGRLPAGTSGSFEFSDPQLQQGYNRYRLMIRMQNGSEIFSEEISLFHFKDAGVVVYPNPARYHNTIHVATPEAGMTRIEIYNAAGRRVHQLRLSSLQNSIPPYTLMPGIYFIRIISDQGGRSTQKLIVY